MQERGASVLVVVEDRLAARLICLHRASHPRCCLAISFLALQDRAEIFAAQFIEGVAAHRGERRIDPLDKSIAATHHEAFGRSLLRMLGKFREDSRLESRRRQDRDGGQRGERHRCGDLGQSGDELTKLVVKFKNEIKLIPFSERHGAGGVLRCSVLECLGNHR